MDKCCENCKHFSEDWSCGACDCDRLDEMTEDEIEKYFTNEEPNCKFHEYDERGEVSLNPNDSK